MYQWDTAVRITPPGWRLPTTDEYQELIDSILEDNSSNILPILDGGKGGFNALLGGREQLGLSTFRENGFYWTSTGMSYKRDHHDYLCIMKKESRYGFDSMYNSDHMSVRYVKADIQHEIIDKLTPYNICLNEHFLRAIDNKENEKLQLIIKQSIDERKNDTVRKNQLAIDLIDAYERRQRLDAFKEIIKTYNNLKAKDKNISEYHHRAGLSIALVYLVIKGEEAYSKLLIKSGANATAVIALSVLFDESIIINSPIGKWERDVN